MVLPASVCQVNPGWKTRIHLQQIIFIFLGFDKLQLAATAPFAVFNHPACNFHQRIIFQRNARPRFSFVGDVKLPHRHGTDTVAIPITNGGDVHFRSGHKFLNNHRVTPLGHYLVKTSACLFVRRSNVCVVIPAFDNHGIIQIVFELFQFRKLIYHMAFRHPYVVFFAKFVQFRFLSFFKRFVRRQKRGNVQLRFQLLLYLDEVVQFCIKIGNDYIYFLNARNILQPFFQH
ncbi:hypothetical protein SDC9_162452 [bioreactor metagenome]|uniref:Uncharacterized protein n=1 Tax=bioreactor metagenome TaxID=1076179 RepID=A0A645FSR6_9ZZZZ